MSNSSVGHGPFGAVEPSAISLNAPTGAGWIANCPVGPVCTGSLTCSGSPVFWCVRNNRSVTPGIGLFALSSTTPVTRVCAGFAGTRADARNADGWPGFPVNVASTTLLSSPSCWPSVSVTATRPSLSLVAVTVVRPPRLPPPCRTVKVTGTPAIRLKPASVTIATKGRASAWPTTPTWPLPVSTTIRWAPGRRARMREQRRAEEARGRGFDHVVAHAGPRAEPEARRRLPLRVGRHGERPDRRRPLTRPPLFSTTRNTTGHADRRLARRVGEPHDERRAEERPGRRRLVVARHHGDRPVHQRACATPRSTPSPRCPTDRSPSPASCSRRAPAARPPRRSSDSPPGPPRRSR